ncbi:MAG: dTMP kinase [Planctomycetota bacterium]
MPQNRPFFVSVDGVDGVGKSTQILELKRHLSERGCSVEQVRDPGSSEIGLRLRELLLETELTMHRRTEAMLFMASRCELIESTIRPSLAAGRCVLSDRFLLSTVVYQSVGDDAASGAEVSPEVLWDLGSLANGGVRPHLTLLLDMPAAKALSRLDRATDRMESRGLDYLEAVRQTFLAQLERSSDRTAIINADQPLEKVSADIRDAVAPLLS